MQTETIKQKVLTAIDRCDSCGAQAYVKVSGVSGELTFCSHHYEKITNNIQAYKKLQQFAFEIIDERNFLNVER